MSNWILILCVAILSIVLGGYAVAFPDTVTMGLNYFLGISLIVLGIASVISGFMGMGQSGAIWTIILGILMVVMGVVIWRNPNVGIFTMAVIVGVLMIFSGIITIVSAFTYETGGYRWLAVISGVASLILAWFAFTSSSETIGILVGIQMIFFGIGMFSLSLAVRSANQIWR